MMAVVAITVVAYPPWPQTSPIQSTLGNEGPGGGTAEKAAPPPPNADMPTALEAGDAPGGEHRATSGADSPAGEATHQLVCHLRTPLQGGPIEARTLGGAGGFSPTLLEAEVRGSQVVIERVPTNASVWLHVPGRTGAIVAAATDGAPCRVDGLELRAKVFGTVIGGAGATIYGCGGEPVVTDDQGHFYLEIRPGSCVLRAEVEADSERRMSAERSLDVEAGEEVAVTLRLAP